MICLFNHYTNPSCLMFISYTCYYNRPERNYRGRLLGKPIYVDIINGKPKTLWYYKGYWR